MKYDDELYLKEGFRREHVDQAVSKYQIKASESKKRGSDSPANGINLGNSSDMSNGKS